MSGARPMPGAVILPYLRRCPFFRHMPTRTLHALAGNFRAASLEGGAMLVRAGEPADRVIFVHEGSLEVLGDVRTGEPLALIGPGGLYAEFASLLARGASPLSVRAHSAVTFFSAAWAVVTEWMETHPTAGSRFYETLAEALADRLQTAYQDPAFLKNCLRGAREV